MVSKKKRLSVPGDVVKVNTVGTTLGDGHGEVKAYVSRSDLLLLISVHDENAFVLVNGMFGTMDVHYLYKEF